MPEFYVDEISIDPEEFVLSCSKREIKELIESLVENEHLPKGTLKVLPTKNQSNLEIEFVENLFELSKVYYSISQEDEEKLKEIFKKYL